MKLRGVQEIIDHIHKSEENNTFRQKNKIKKEETRKALTELLKMVDKAMEPIYIKLKKETLEKNQIQNISYNMLEGIDETFEKYLREVTEAIQIGGFSHMYNSYRQLYYNPKELIDIYEKIKSEKIFRKFKITKNIKLNKENVVREILRNYREISNDISEEDKKIVMRYKNSLAFRKFFKEEADEDNIKEMKEIGKFVGNEKENFINFFKAQKGCIEKNARQAYIEDIEVVINILEQMKLLSKYQEEYKKDLKKLNLEEFAYENETTEKGLGIKEIFSEENLNKLPMKTLMAQSAFWCNRLTKEIENMNNAKFICKDLDLIDKMLNFRIEKIDGKENIISEEILEKELEKISFLTIVIEKIVNQVEEDIKKNRTKGEIEIESYIRKVSADYQEEYLKYFNKKLPMCNNIIRDDIKQMITAKNMISNLYKGKNAINFALLEEALINDKILNWGLINAEKRKNDKFILLGFDIDKLSGPLFLHMPKNEIKEFLKRNKLENKIPIYQGKRDFIINGIAVTRKLLMPIDQIKMKQLEELKINQQEEIDKFNFIEHCKYIASGDIQKYPKHLKKIKYIGKGKKQKQKLIIQKEFIDLDTNEKYQKDETGSFQKVEDIIR